MAESKLLFKFDSEWQAQPVIDLLKSNGVEVQTLATPREYTSILTGMGQMGQALYVNESQFVEAQALLLAYFQRSNIQLVTDDNTKLPEGSSKNYFRRVMFFSLGGMFFLPIIFNVVAAFNLRGLFKFETSKIKLILAMITFCTSWVVSGFELYWIILNYIINV